jgi:DNA-binding transcriptional LysR family regulator
MGRLEELEVFVAIAELGSLVAAARRTGRSAPSVTRTLRALETRLGARLVERTTRSLALTDVGLRLAASAGRILAEVGEAEVEAVGDKILPRGRLRVTAPLVFGRRLVAPILLDYLDVHPETTVELSLNDRIVDLIDEGFDLALRIGNLGSSAQVRRQIGVVRKTLVASPSYLDRMGIPQSPADFGTHQFVALNRSLQGIDARFQGMTEPATAARLYVDQAETAIAATLAGRGMLSTLSYQVAEHIAAGRLVRLLPHYEPPPLPVQFVFPAARLMPPRVRAFVNMAVPRLATLLRALTLDDSPVVEAGKARRARRG